MEPDGDLQEKPSIDWRNRQVTFFSMSCMKFSHFRFMSQVLI